MRSCVNHSQKDTSEESSELIISGTLKLGTHVRTSNGELAHGRYAVLLGMTWHVSHNPRINSVQRVVHVGGDEIPASSISHERVPTMQVTNLSFKKFRWLLSTKSRSNNVHVSQAIQANMMKGCNGKRDCNPKLEALLQQFDTVFKNELPEGLPPERAVDYKIVIEDGVKRPHRSLFQLFPGELVACKEYVQDLRKKEKIQTSISPFGTPLFFVKNKGNQLRWVVDYRASNRISKKKQ